MVGVKIDKDVCSVCGKCVEVCPHDLIREEGGEIICIPDNCMKCGHCRAVCPTGAILVDSLTDRLNLSLVEEDPGALQPGDYDSKGLVQLMRSRRSCRSYTETKVPLELLEDLVKIGTTAPSGTNSQSWNFVILPQRKDVEVLGNLTARFYRQLNSQAANPFYRFLARIFAGDKLSTYYRNYYDSVRQALRDWDETGRDRLFHGATAAILVTGRRDASCPAEDALLATQNILLAAHSLGLGSCLIGFAVAAIRRSSVARKAISIPDEEEIYSVIGLGYPAGRYVRAAGRVPVKSRVLSLDKTE